MRSIQRSHCIACSFVSPHMFRSGRNDRHTAGRSARPNSLHRAWSSSWTQRTSAGLPIGMSGMALVMDGAMQHAPHWGRQFTWLFGS
jgi:hypothetical protein